jgi:hypothetical protein
VRSAETCDLHDVKRSWCVSGSRQGGRCRKMNEYNHKSISSCF